MIRVSVLKRDGFIQITARQHGRADVCAAASMILQAAALGLRDCAKQWPREITFDGDVYGSEHDEALDSTDNRKRGGKRR